MEIIRVTWQINGLKNDTRRCQWLFGGFLYRRNKKTRLHKLIKHLAVCYCLLQFVGYTLAICTHIPRYNENIVPGNYSRIVIPVPFLFFPFSLFPRFPALDLSFTFWHATVSLLPTLSRLFSPLVPPARERSVVLSFLRCFL